MGAGLFHAQVAPFGVVFTVLCGPHTIKATNYLAARLSARKPVNHRSRTGDLKTYGIRRAGLFVPALAGYQAARSFAWGRGAFACTVRCMNLEKICRRSAVPCAAPCVLPCLAHAGRYALQVAIFGTAFSTYTTLARSRHILSRLSPAPRRTLVFVGVAGAVWTG